MFRSQSGPGGLSINTASANALSNQSSGAPPSGSVPSKPLFGNIASTSQPQSASSVFGNAQTQPPGGQPAGSGLFGAQPNTVQSTGGGLFGSQQPNQQKPSNAFGFNNTQQSQTQNSGGLFGSTLAQNPTQQTNSSLFGNSSFGLNPGPIPSSNQNSTQNQFSTIPPAPPSLFSNTIGQHSQQQQTVPGVRISVNELRPTTRFNDLHEDLQKTIEYVDSFILNKIQWQEQCADSSEAIHTMTLQVPPDVEFCSKQLDTLQQALENDAESIALAKKLVRTDAANAKLSFKAIHSLKTPQYLQQSSMWTSTSNPPPPISEMADADTDGSAGRNIVDYFSTQGDTMAKALGDCKRNVAQIEQYLRGVETNIAQQSQRFAVAGGQTEGSDSLENQVKELAAVLRAFENGILGVATKIGAAREMVQDVMLDSGAPMLQGRRFGAT